MHSLHVKSLIFPIQPEADAAEVSCVSVTPKGKPLLPDDLLRKNKPKQLLDIVLIITSSGGDLLLSDVVTNICKGSLPCS